MIYYIIWLSVKERREKTRTVLVIKANSWSRWQVWSTDVVGFHSPATETNHWNRTSSVVSFTTCMTYNIAKVCLHFTTSNHETHPYPVTTATHQNNFELLSNRSALQRLQPFKKCYVHDKLKRLSKTAVFMKQLHQTWLPWVNKLLRYSVHFSNEQHIDDYRHSVLHIVHVCHGNTWNRDPIQIYTVWKNYLLTVLSFCGAKSF